MKEFQLLLVRRAYDPWKGMWDIPGGFCEPGEHPMSTVRREVFEEGKLRLRNGIPSPALLWTHVAVTPKGSLITVFLNGVAQ